MFNQPSGASSGAILILDVIGSVIWVSDAAAALIALNPEELMGRKPSDFLNHLLKGTSDLPSDAGSGGSRPIRFNLQNGSVVEVCEARGCRIETGGQLGAVWVLRSLREPLSKNAESFRHDSVAKSFLGTGLDGVFLLSNDGRYTYVNSIFAELCGYQTPQEFLAAMSSDSGHSYVEPSRYDELMRGLRQSGEITRFESAIYRRDGTTTWISESVRAVFDGEGSVLQYEGTAQDIGWRKLAEEILHQAEEKWRAVVESSSESIVIADRSGVVFFANDKAQQSCIGIPGKGVFAEFTPPSQYNLRAAIDRSFQNMRPEVLTLEHSRSGAPSSWYEIRVVPIGNDESVSRVILIATDLTGRKQAEEAVREGQRLIGRVADASPAILYVYDFTTGRYVYVNHQVEKILGYTTEAFLAEGKSLSDSLVHRDDAGLLTERRRLLAEARDDGVVFEYTFRMRHAGGQWLWIRARDVVFTRGADGRPVQIIGMAEDVTELRRAGQERERSREQLRALSARLQEAREEERAAISRRVHDELGQALTALSWELSKLSDQLENSAGRQPEFAQRLAGMSAMMDAMMQIVRKVSAELRPPILDHFGLVAAIEWQAKEFQERYRITCEVAARRHSVIRDRAVSTAVFRIFQEILTNVARHSGATKVRVQFNDSARGIALIVHDNGRGITEGQKSQSLGILGMSERAHLFGGSIEIEGAPNRGTTVTVHIPLASGTSGIGPRKETLRPPR